MSPLCKCCRREPETLNEFGLCPECETCLHCEARPAVNGYGLCSTCSAVPGFVLIYTRRPGWTPEWEMHLRAMTHLYQSDLKRLSGDRYDETEIAC